MPQDDPIVVKTIGVYAIEQYIISAVAKRMFEGNESQAVRYMIREYPKNNPFMDDGAPLGILQAAVPKAR